MSPSESSRVEQPRNTRQPLGESGPEPRALTGIEGVDDILGGGFMPNRLYLLEGVPGSGKTTLALQFLMAGVAAGEAALYITLSETEEEMRAVADSHAWDLSGITLRELLPGEDSLRTEDQYTMFHPSEVELSETTRTILEEVEQSRPRRIVFDSLSELRLLAGNPLRYRRQVLALKQFFGGRRCTVLLLDDMTTVEDERHVHSMAHGVIRLEQIHPDFGSERRRLIVLKYRGAQFRGGYHDYVIRRGGLTVFPRLVASEHHAPPRIDKLSSGVAAIDALLGGGLDRGTSTLVVGAAGTGKSTLAAQFAHAEVARGGRVAWFAFDESRHTLLVRCTGVGIDLTHPVASGELTILQVNPAEISPGELAHDIRHSVQANGATMVVIDSLNGYLNAMPGERFLIVQLHELLTFLGQSGVATMLVAAHGGLVGAQMVTPVDASYLADAVVLMRYFEAQAEIRQAISVIKKRTGAHERTLREFTLSSSGIQVGPPLREFHGVLTGVPTVEVAA
jgi:circadian clock protein KaiC